MDFGNEQNGDDQDQAANTKRVVAVVPSLIGETSDDSGLLPTNNRTLPEDPSLIAKGNAPTKSESGGSFLSQHLPWKKSKKNTRINQELEEEVIPKTEKDSGSGTLRGFTSSLHLPWTKNNNDNKDTSTNNNSARRPESRQITDDMNLTVDNDRQGVCNDDSTINNNNTSYNEEEDGDNGRRPPLTRSITWSSEVDSGRQQNQISNNKSSDQIADLSADSFINKKMVAQGLMDFAFLSANASQLRYVIAFTKTDKKEPYLTVNLVMISISIAFQIIVGLLMVSSSYYKSLWDNQKRKRLLVTYPNSRAAEEGSIRDAAEDIRRQRVLDVVFHITVAIIFIIAVLNIFIASFSVQPTAS